MKDDEKMQWFVMRDLKRRNAKLPAYKQLIERGIQVFVPVKQAIIIRKGKIVREEVPVIQDLLFVYSSRLYLDPIVKDIPTLQYRWLRNTFREPMTVSNLEMEKFIFAVKNAITPQYYLPEEITPQMCGRKIRIVGGTLNGYEGYLLTIRGSKVKRLLVKLGNCLAVSVEILPEYIQLL